MPIDNNILERDIRVFATGRKSWLFSDTTDGAKASAVIYSLMLTCRAVGSTHSPGYATCLLSCLSAKKPPTSATCCRSTSPKPPLPDRPGYRFAKGAGSEIPPTSMCMENNAYSSSAKGGL
jgi:hypothetical protein